jgi:ribosomal protein S12 methylthiotransferase accessory factor
MEIIVSFPGGTRVDTEIGGHVIKSDQPAYAGGQDSAPAPFSLFLASIGTCAGYYVLSFCSQRKIPTEGIRIIQRLHKNPETKMIDIIDLDIEVPPEFPAKYYDALVRAANQCAVKKHIEIPPRFEVRTVVKAAAGV